MSELLCFQDRLNFLGCTEIISDEKLQLKHFILCICTLFSGANSF